MPITPQSQAREGGGDGPRQIILGIQALLLGALAVAGLLVAATSPSGVAEVAGFCLSITHSAVLLATACRERAGCDLASGRSCLVLLQAAVYTVVFLIGVPASAGPPQDNWLALNAPDHFLHLGLALLGGILGTTLLVDPPSFLRVTGTRQTSL